MKRKSAMGLTNHPLNDKNVLHTLLMQEDDLLMQRGNLQTITDLTKIYSDLIEYYDNRKDPITIYFKEKIQILLSNKETLKLLETKQSDKEIEKYQRRSKISMNTKKELRSKMVEFNSKITKTNEEERKKSIQGMIKKHEKHYKDINNHIKKETQTQEDAFKRKMSQRRERSMNRSLSKSIDKKRGNKRGGNGNTNNLLKHLDKVSKEKMDNPFET